MNPLMIAASETRRRLGLARNPFLGEVLASDFITGNALAAAIGLAGGVAQNSDEPWLKFKDPVDGKTKLVAKKAYRHSITWNHIASANAVYGARTIVIGGKTYKVRLFKGANSDPSTVPANTYDHPGTHGSEWNRLMYHISGRPFGGAPNTLASEGIDEGDWAQYSEAELLTRYTHGSGALSWCQESQGSTRLWRGHGGVALAYYDAPGYTSSYYGWRPVLELVE